MYKKRLLFGHKYLIKGTNGLPNLARFKLNFSFLVVSFGKNPRKRITKKKKCPLLITHEMKKCLSKLKKKRKNKDLTNEKIYATLDFTEVDAIIL